MTARPRPDGPAGGHPAVRSDIQGLRGIAVLLVVLYHAGLPWLPGGYIGVDVFFVISGYLITGMLVREVQSNGRIDLPNFIARRARRLLPAALVLIGIVVAASVWIYPPLERADIVSAARAAALYVANLWFTARAVDYLGGDAAINPMLHMWSLGVEEQFYLLWPLLIGLAAYRTRGEAAARRVWRMTLVVSLVSFAACVWMTRTSQPWAFFVTPFRAWEFGLGALAYLAGPRLQAAPAAWSQLAGWAGWAGAAAVVASAFALGHHTLFPGPWALLPAGGTAMVLLALGAHQPARPGGMLRAALAFGPLARVGDVSYSWYLWHWPLIVMLPVLHPQAGPAGMLAAVALSYLAAEASYRWVERPFRVGHAARARPRLAVATALSATVVSAVALSVVHARTVDAPVSARQQLFIDARNDTPGRLAPGCHVRIRDTAVTACDAGDKAAERVVVLLGDSHAQHWYPALDALGAEQGWRLVSMTKSACPWVDTPVSVELAGFRRPYGECEVWRKEAVARTLALAPAAVVLASGSRYAGVDATQWEAGARRTLKALEPSGATLVIVRDTPWPGFNVPTCLARAEHRNADPERACTFAREAALAPGLPIHQAELRAAEGLSDLVSLDLLAHFCTDTTCSPANAGTVRYSDHSHLSASYARRLAPAFQAALSRANRSSP